MTQALVAPLSRRRWSVVYEVTLSDTNSEKNLQRNGKPYPFIQNVGTSGLVMIVWDNGTTVDLYLGQGVVMEGGQWVHARTTDTTAGVDLRGYW